MNHVGDRGTDEIAARCPADADTLVVLDLGDGAAKSVAEGVVAARVCGREPERTSRESPVRRIRAARWSSENRLWSLAVSFSWYPKDSINDSCWSTSVLFLRTNVSNMIAT